MYSTTLYVATAILGTLMAIYPQPNDWECGPYALKYALIVLGISGDEREIARIAGTDEHGTDEAELARAAKRYGCELQLVRRRDPEESRSELEGCLRERIPVLLCVHGWDHWVTVAGADGGEFIILDGRDPSVLSVMPWQRLREILLYREGAPGGGHRAVYDLHPLVPRVRTPIRARLSVASVRHLRAEGNRALARTWDRYLEDLVAVCTVPTLQHAFSVALSDMLWRSEEDVLHRAHRLAGTIEVPALRRILENLCFVAATYELRVPVGQEQRALDAVSEILSRRASAALHEERVPATLECRFGPPSQLKSS
jgi:hypothetical protein